MDTDLTPEARADRVWLVERLGKERVAGPALVTLGEEGAGYEVELTRKDGKRSWFYAPDPAAALALARQHVAGLVPPNRRKP